MLEGLSEIDWSRLTHPFGDACDIPDLIRDLASDDEDARSNTREMLSYRICNEAPVETIAAVVPFLIELAAHPEVEEREEILQFLAEIAGQDTEHEVHGAAVEPLGLDSPAEVERVLRRTRELAWSRAAREAVEFGLATFLNLLADEDPKVRIGAARLLAKCRGPAARLVPEMTVRVRAQADPRVRAALILAIEALAEAADQSDTVVSLFTESMRPGEAPVVRLMAALCRARSSPGPPSAGIVEILCETAAAAWRDFEDAAGSDLAYSVGEVLKGNPEARLRFLSRPLDSPDAYVRNSARHAAAQLGYDSRSITRAVGAALGQRLSAADLRGRRHITEILSGFGAAATDAIVPLVTAISDDDSQVRTNAALALAGLRDLRALPVLIERLETFRTPGVSSLTAIRDRDSLLSFVGQSLADEVFPMIADALGGFGATARAAVPLLVDLLQPPPSETLHGQHRPTSIARALGRIGPDARPAIPALIALMESCPEAQLCASIAIGCIGGPEARAAVPLLTTLFRSPDESSRIVAAEAVWRIGGDARLVLPVLFEQLRPEAPCCSMAAKVIGEIGEAAREAIPALVACVKHEDASASGRWVRLEAAIAIWRIENRVDRALPALIRSLEEPGPAIPRIVRRAAENLAEMGAEARAAIPLLRGAAASDDRSSGRQYLYHDGAISEDDAVLAAIARALRRVQGDPRAGQE
jgi:HEAT repeat protein